MYAELARICRICGIEKPNEEFHLNGLRRKNGTSAPRTECKDCSTEIHRQYVAKKRDQINAQRRQRYSENHNGIRDKLSHYSVKKLYGLTREQYQNLLKEQKGRCKLCEISQEDSPRRFDVDHCHVTGKIRGLLCIKCNRGIGLLQDSEVIIQRALDLIRSARTEG